MTIENETAEILEQGDIVEGYQEPEVTEPVEELPEQVEQPQEPPKEEPKPEKKKLSFEERQAQIDKKIKEQWEAKRAFEETSRAERESLRKEKEELLALRKELGRDEDAPPNPANYTEDQAQKYIQDLAKYEAKKIVKEQMTNNDKQAKEKAEFEHKEKIKIAYNQQYSEKIKADPSFADREMNVAKYLQLTNRDDLVTLIMDDDDRAEIIDYLGGNLEKLEEIAELSPMRVAKELGKITATINSPKSRTVSKANAPINPLRQTGGNAIKDPSDMDHKSYSDYMNKKQYGY